MELSTRPVAVIGAVPIGLPAAAQLMRAGETPLVLEAGTVAGTSVLEWGHVRIVSPWLYNVDAAARELVLAAGWQTPDTDGQPIGRELVEWYVSPLTALPQLAPRRVSTPPVVQPKADGCCLAVGCEGARG